MGLCSSKKENHVVETPIPQREDIDITLHAMVLGSNVVFLATLNAAIELSVLECLLRLLASYSLLTDEDGSTMRFYAISPSSKYFVHDENGGGYPTSFTSFLCHPV
ncbi:hypothetical protein JHK82_022276 [Glycine max]|nr:hypothetical protein JHK82_022276 [Glycine max]